MWICTLSSALNSTSKSKAVNVALADNYRTVMEQRQESSSAETSEACFSIALSDLVASFAQPTETNVSSEELDHDDPEHCHFFQEGRCKYSDPNYIAPTTTDWMGCEFPECNNWFHESCLGLEFATELERDNYAYVCKFHDRISHYDRFKG